MLSHAFWSVLCKPLLFDLPDALKEVSKSLLDDAVLHTLRLFLSQQPSLLKLLPALSYLSEEMPQMQIFLSEVLTL